jgi:hypothetical protein
MNINIPLKEVDRANAGSFDDWEAVHERAGE